MGVAWESHERRMKAVWESHENRIDDVQESHKIHTMPLTYGRVIDKYTLFRASYDALEISTVRRQRQLRMIPIINEVDNKTKSNHCRWHMYCYYGVTVNSDN